jgi:hypothetical protein
MLGDNRAYEEFRDGQDVALAARAPDDLDANGEEARKTRAPTGVRAK